MEAVKTLKLEEVVERLMSLKFGETFDFAGMSSENDLNKATPNDLTCWYGAKVINEFDQDILLVGYYGGSPMRAFSLQDDVEFIRYDLEKFLKECDVIPWNYEGCYIVEEVKEQEKVINETAKEDIVEVDQYKVYDETYVLDRTKTDRINRLLHEKPLTPDECLIDPDDSETFGITFDNGYSFEIHICGVDFEEGSDNLPWAEIRFFDPNDHEIFLSEVEDEVFGVWRIADTENNNLFIVRVEESPEKERLVKIGDLAVMSGNSGTHTMTVQDNSVRGAATVPVEDVKVGDHVLIANHFTRVVRDDILHNTYPEHKDCDWDDVQKKIEEYNHPKAEKTAKADVDR